MKNSIRAMLAMIAILPCALFFTACGGEKITTEQANEAFATAITETGNVSTDFKIELNLSGSLINDGESASGNIKGALVKTGEAIKNEDGTYNVDAVKVGVTINGSLKNSNQKNELNYNYSAGKVGDKYVVVDNNKKDNKVYQDFSEFSQFFGMSIGELISAIIGDEESGSESLLPDLPEIDFSEISLESETMKLDAVKTGDKDFEITLKGYEIILDIGMKIEGKCTVVIKDSKLSSFNVDVKVYAPDQSAMTETTDPTDASIYKTKVANLKGSIKMIYGEQKVNLPKDLTGYTEGSVFALA